MSALIGGGKAAQLTSHLNLALEHGITPDELSALITNAAFVSGWPNAVSAITVANEVFTRRGVRTTSRAEVPVVRVTSPASAGGSPLAQYGSVADGLWRGADLSPRDRALSTIAVLVAAGDTGGLADSFARGRAAGLTEAQVDEALLHLSFYVGRTKAEAAEPLAAAAYGGHEAGATGGMAIVRRGAELRSVPAETFTGRASISTPFRGSGGARVGGATVAFEPGARTYWHRHPLGQTLAIADGCGWTQVEGGPVERICAGNVVWVEPGAKHWHGATRSEGMTHVAIAERLHGSTVEWLGPVSDAQYAAGGTAR